ncbi:uncharacterized protein [Solanum tuberosum]|uniref:uncharacterized protein n=1 Tax=Solanum tuberosum TaxID=4113 RepID=UPI00073A2743|nr:PREDICTED: uncharacterized protein LOC107059880 [Solanum tuberosum]
MAAPPSLEEGQSTTRPPRFNGQYYGWWKTRMYDYSMAEDNELCDVILDGPYIPTKDVKEGDVTRVIPKSRREYDEVDKNRIEKNYKDKKLLVCGIGTDEYNMISACENAKEIWDCLKIAHEGTTQVKESELDMLITRYEKFSIKEGETIHEMHTRFTSITNELRCLGEPIHSSKQDSSKWKGRKEKSVALKVSQNDVSEDEDEMAYLTKRFQKHGGFQKKGTISRMTNANDLYHKCGKPNQVVKKAFAVWENASSDSEEEEHHDDVFMMAVKDDENVLNSIFSLMAKSDDEDDNDEVTFFDLKGDIDTLSIKRLRKLVDVLIDSVDELTNENLILSENLNLCEDENSALISQMFEMNFRLSILETESHQLEEEPGTSKSRKRKLSSFELELEESLKISEFKLVAALERNSQLIRNSIVKRGSSQCWFMESGCLKHMTGETQNFLSLEAHQGGDVSFGDDKKGFILGIGKIGRSVEHSIDNVLGHVSSSLLNKLVVGDLVHGLPKLKFYENKIGDACMRRKKTGSSFKKKKRVITTRPLELLYMDLCGLVRIQNRDVKKYILQNGVVERKNRTLVDIARTMLIDSGLAINFWSEVVNTTCYVTNRCLMRSVLKKTPYELLNGRKPSLSHLKAFGCKCVVLNNGKDDLGKFDPKSDEGKFVLTVELLDSAGEINNI